MALNQVHSIFYCPDEFTFLQSLKESWKEILQEFKALEEHALHPWPESNLYQISDFTNQQIQTGKGWDVFGLYAFGKRRNYGCELCPITAEIVESFPTVPKTVSFSQLLPNTNILPHSGYVGYSSKVLRVHLGLQIPEKASPLSKVENDSRSWFEQSVWDFNSIPIQNYRESCCLHAGHQVSTWKEGELLVFDDSYEHEAWNFTSEKRVVLLIDIERPKKYWPDMMQIEDQTKIATERPYTEGNRGELYLDKLTKAYGYTE